MPEILPGHCCCYLLLRLGAGMRWNIHRFQKVEEKEVVTKRLKDTNKQFPCDFQVQQY